VQRIDLGAALPVILETHPHRQGEQVGEAFLKRLAPYEFGCKVSVATPATKPKGGPVCAARQGAARPPV